MKKLEISLPRYVKRLMIGAISLLIPAMGGSSSFLYADNKLDIGTEYRMRGIKFTNTTYGSELPLGSASTLDPSYYSHRARTYVKAKLNPGIEIGAVLQAIGVQGSTQALLNRYPQENFTPFFENVYIQANDVFDLPINFGLGRQPYRWGSGLLIADDGLGFDSVRLDAGPLWGFKTHFFSAKAKEQVAAGDHDLLLAGLSYAWGIHNVKFGWILDSDKSGTPYSNLSSTGPLNTSKITRQYLDLQVGGRLEKGAFYNAEFALQSGGVDTPNILDPVTQTTFTRHIDLSGSALTFEGGFDFVHPRWGRMILAFVFMQGSGDNVASKDKDEKFNTGFGHRYDGLERAGAGELFAATPYSFFNEDKAVVSSQVSGSTQAVSNAYTSLFSGLRTFGFRGSINPIDSFVAGLEFYIFTARETPDIRNGSPTTINDNELGRELIITAHYTYAKRINFGIRWGKFFSSTNLNNIGSSRLMLEAQARF